MMLREITCSCCEKKILRKSMDGNWRISSRVIKSSPDGMKVVAVCRECNNEEVMPMMITMSPVMSNPSEMMNRGDFMIRRKKNLDGS
jgi:hypothetical protein